MSVMEARGERSVSAGGDIGVVVTGDYNVVTLGPSVRSAYWEQVRRIAPPELMGRAAELADLAAFCTTDSGPAYAWWRADAWAGKTALMSWFALHPPAGVRIVPFFVTARLGAQNDATAYVDVVLEQLTELAGEGLPAHLTESTREAHLLHLYGAAAAACERRGERLVLLVDGLDEDRGVTTRSDAHSIAGLLPPAPRCGMRVLVAGRLNPPLPGDVAEGHPLREPGIVRGLASSPYAEAIRTEAERELKQLIEAGGLEYDLLALVTAAGGGLTAQDLAELTGAVPYRVADVLRTRAGRTFGVRGNVCLLGHEELQTQAQEMLGRAELARYQEQLHAWADGWQARGWPDGTPEYLLRGYFRLLTTLDDHRRMLPLALDPRRHERLAELTGADAAALAETRVAAEHLVWAGDPDLCGLLRLAMCRTELEARNLGISAQMCRSRAELGQGGRAEAMARAMPTGLDRADALAEVAEVLCAQGEHERALDLAQDALELLAGRTVDGRTGSCAVRIVGVLAALGLDEEAERLDRLVTRIPFEPERDPLVGELVGAWANAGRYERAEALARSLGPWHAPEALVRLAEALARACESDRADALFDEAERLARSHGLVRTLHMLLAAGEPERAGSLLRAALADTSTVGRPRAHLVGLLARTGEFERAADWLVSIEDGWDRSSAAADLTEALAAAGRIAEAELLLEEIDEDQDDYDCALAVIVEALVAAGLFDRSWTSAARLGIPGVGADALARGAVSRAAAGYPVEAAAFLARVEAAVRARVPDGRTAGVRATVAKDLRAAGHTEAALAVLEDVESLIPGRPGADADFSDAFPHDSAVAWAAEELACSGQLNRAEELAATAVVPFHVRGAWSAIVRALIEKGEYARAVTLAHGQDQDLREFLYGEMAPDLAATGEVRRAVALVDRVEKPEVLSLALAAMAEALAVSGRDDRARAVLDDWARRGEAAPGTAGWWGGMMTAAHLLGAWHALGEDAATRREINHAMEFGSRRDMVCEPVLRALVASGHNDHAERFAGEVDGPGRWGEAHDVLVEELVAAGEYDRAARLAGLDDDPSRLSLRSAVALAPHTDTGRDLVVRALDLGDWVDVLPALVRLDPRTVPVVVETLRGAAAPAL
ncbi:tetratricopeptide repeat protein [Streptomyces sp. NBC_00490]|uniref:tetratricopeptide repeat protein n=1 Tax=Streptomyces sp. NBC_00490 TaxID=2903657 RepID=UPI002E18A0F2